MDWVRSIALGVLAWMAVVLFARNVIAPRLSQGPKREAVMGMVWRIVRMYCRVVHRVKYAGEEQLRSQTQVGPMIVMSNHTGAVDPLLISAGCRFHIRWMMASDMMSDRLDWIWEQAEVIPVDRDGRDSGPLREAIRHLRAGGVIGIFPEGRIAVPPREIRPFFPGVGMLVSRTGAPVLLAWISGTTDTNEMAKSLMTPSRARVEFVEVVQLGGKADAAEATELLREKLAKASGWRKNNEPVPPSERGQAVK